MGLLGCGCMFYPGGTVNVRGVLVVGWILAHPVVLLLLLLPETLTLWGDVLYTFYMG